MLKYIEYLRVGTIGQTETVAGRRSILRQMIKKHALTVVAYIEDADGSSVVAGARPGFNKLIEMLKNGHANAIVCVSPENLTRNLIEMALLEQLRNEGSLVEIRTPAGFLPKSASKPTVLNSRLAISNEKQA